MNYEVMAADLELLMSDMGIQKAHILGHSMGGKLAMTLALTKVGTCTYLPEIHAPRTSLSVNLADKC